MKITMKKHIAVLAGLVLLFCSGAVARSREEKKKAKEETKEIVRELKEHQNSFKDTKGTPEDSVIFYGGFEATANDYLFTQINSDFEPDSQSMRREYMFVSEPVQPGSRYMLEYWWYWTASTPSSSGSYASQYFTQQTSPLIIDIPEEPGLYYFGYYSGIATVVNGRLIECGYAPSAEMRDSALKAVLRRYRGTAWEPLIKKELAEAKVAVKEHMVERKAEAKEARKEAASDLKTQRARKRQERKEKKQDTE